jgi:hypothetical protein
MSMRTLQLVGALICSLVLGSIFSTPVHAASSGGLDSTTDTLQISVNGQQTITLTANDPGGTPPSVAGIAVASPMNFGQTTAGVWTTNASIDPVTGNVTTSGNITAAGTTTIVAGVPTTIGGSVTASGNITATGTTTIVGGVPTTTGGNMTASGNITATGGYVQPAGYADTAQPACGPTNQGALIYSTTQNAALVCNGTTGTWVSAFSSSPIYHDTCGGSSTGIVLSTMSLAFACETINTQTASVCGHPMGTWCLPPPNANPPQPAGTYQDACAGGMWGISTMNAGFACETINTQTASVCSHPMGTWCLP